MQALLECLDTALGVDDHVQEDRTWAVTATTLVRALPRRVRELAEIHDAEQTATTGGQLEDVPFHTLPGKPQVPITLTLAPEDAAQVARARLFDPQAGDLFAGEAFAPTIAREVPAGNYVLEVRIEPPTPPFGDVPVFVVPALPPSYSGTVEVAAP